MPLFHYRLHHPITITPLPVSGAQDQTIALVLSLEPISPPGPIDSEPTVFAQPSEKPDRLNTKTAGGLKHKTTPIINGSSNGLILSTTAVDLHALNPRNVFDAAMNPRHPLDRSMAKPAQTAQRREWRGFDTIVRADGSMHLHDRSTVGSPEPNTQPPGTILEFDSTVGLMRMVDQDPFLVDKLKVLDDTREQRTRMAQKHHDQQIRNSWLRLPKQLAEIAASQTTLEVKQRSFFTLWDECAEESDASTEIPIEAFREFILLSIRKHFPQHSAQEYSKALIEALNQQRQSAQRFTPYETSAR